MECRHDRTRLLMHVKLADGPSQPKTPEQRRGEFDPVVLVELQLRKQIAQRDTQERPGAERQGAADKSRRFTAFVPGAEKE